MKTRTAIALGLALSGLTHVRGDMVTDWNANLERAIFDTAQPVPAQARFAAIMHVAMFDAVNGIARKYTPYYTTETAPPGARPEAAAAQAACTVLKALYPSQSDLLDAQLSASLSNIPGGRGRSQSIQQGRSWGEFVANQILKLRNADGWATPPPPYFGSFDPGVWRSMTTPGFPDGTLPALVTQLAGLTPFAMSHPAQFRPGPPYAPTRAEALASAAYAADLNEVKTVGRVDSAVRTGDQGDLARLWQAMGPVDLNRAARSVVPARNSLVDNARLFALLNMATCDGLIASMESKFIYELWRPHHAIRLADTDGNAATLADPEWTALIVAPRFPEYISNHSSLSAAFMRVLSRELGDEYTFSVSSPNYPDFTWTYGRFSEVAAQAKEARIWAGIHFRHACDTGEQVGTAVADYVLDNFLTPLR
jgi:hypothetical protein